MSQVDENLKQADFLLSSPNGSRKPRSKAEMNEIGELLAAAESGLDTGDQRRMFETVKAKYDFLKQRDWHGSGSTIAWAVGFAALFFFGARVDRSATVPATIAGVWLVVGVALYSVSCFYPNFFATGERLDDLNPYAGDNDEPITKRDLRVAARKASGRATDLSDGFEIGKGISAFLIGLLKSFVLPFIGITNFFRFWR